MKLPSTAVTLACAALVGFVHATPVLAASETKAHDKAAAPAKDAERKPAPSASSSDKASAAATAAAKSEPPADKRGGDAHAGAKPHEVHWTYAGDTGPEDWGRLQPEFLQCYTGKQQSPIDIARTQHKKLVPLAFAYQPGKLNVVNNGHTVQYNFDPGSVLEVDGRKYELVQTHFHAPSEHAVGGKRFPAEFHLVHKSSDGKIAVVGVLLSVGPANEGYRRFLDAAPSAKGEERRNPNASLNPADLLPKGRTYVRYDGSLTTPPCTEGVAWHVLVQPVEVSAAQLEQLKRLYSGNARPVQRLNARELVDSLAP